MSSDDFHTEPPTGPHDDRQPSSFEDEHVTNQTGRRNHLRHGPTEDTTQADHPLDSEAPWGYLFVRRPGRVFGHFFTVRSNALIGTGDGNAIQLDDDTAGDSHAYIQIEITDNFGVFSLYDLGTEVGTYINGQRVAEHAIIQENDEIIIGEHVFIFKTLY